MIDHFGPEDNRWRYPELDTEYEPNEGRYPLRALDLDSRQGYYTAANVGRLCAHGGPKELWDFGFRSVTRNRSFSAYDRVTWTPSRYTLTTDFGLLLLSVLPSVFTMHLHRYSILTMPDPPPKAP